MLNEYDIMIDGILLKPNMILPGLDADVATPAEVAEYTVRTVLRSIPPAVPGIHFLSGGMSEEESTLNLQVRRVPVATSTVPLAPARLCTALMCFNAAFLNARQLSQPVACQFGQIGSFVIV